MRSTAAAAEVVAAPAEGEAGKEEESRREEQEMLETRLQEAETLVEESKQTAGALEAVVADLREEQVREEHVHAVGEGGGRDKCASRQPA